MIQMSVLKVEGFSLLEGESKLAVIKVTGLG